MSQTPLPPSPADTLQFDVVEPAPGSAEVPAGAHSMTCIGCGQPILTTYYALADKVLCPLCYSRVNAGPVGSRAGRVGKAAALGLGAGLLGALIWLAIRRIAHMEIGLVAVLVGYMVGKAVRKGSGGFGGRGYQVLAVVLTYCCIAANYMPDIFQAIVRDHSVHHLENKNAPAGTPAAPPRHSTGRMIVAVVIFFVIVFVESLTVPFAGGAQNILGLLIISFALWEAWKLNTRRKLPLTGPYQVGGVIAAASGGALA